MTPQILGNLTALAQKVQAANQAALQAQQMALNAASQSSSSTGTSSSGGIHWVTPATVTTSNGPVSFTTYNASGTIGLTASSVLLRISARRNYTTTGWQYITGRATGTTQTYTLYGQNSNGVDSDTEGCTVQVWCPVTSGSFDYQIDAGVMDVIMQVVGWS